MSSSGFATLPPSPDISDSESDGTLQPTAASASSSALPSQQHVLTIVPVDCSSPTLSSSACGGCGGGNEKKGQTIAGSCCSSHAGDAAVTGGVGAGAASSAHSSAFFTPAKAEDHSRENSSAVATAAAGHGIHVTKKEDMLEPRVAFAGPYRMHVLYPGEDGKVPECDCGKQHLTFGKSYYYCTCGLSAKQPLCDGSHSGTIFKPQKFTVDKRQTFYLLCGCKRTDKPPYCDGSHGSKIDWAALQW